jgi:hypothetical protein
VYLCPVTSGSSATISSVYASAHSTRAFTEGVITTVPGSATTRPLPPSFAEGRAMAWLNTIRILPPRTSTASVGSTTSGPGSSVAPSVGPAPSGGLPRLPSSAGGKTSASPPSSAARASSDEGAGAPVGAGSPGPSATHVGISAARTSSGRT